ncbi:spermatogenesis-associated protein 7-like isoform X1 [Polyodon spathula]|uniref:spermatogenesis-associated protein 7-like isoform X1 n=2 Tax=Polyodon spathula TaxID=7913 RepID=UPI001B7F6846|nr:spermatogenesis-associated protein 7-like isoform X1 [Polyodon spathula]XP_041123145.1 spermatogenesis-associated protein 7-like isoform X1 [Polyodon spathula]
MQYIVQDHMSAHYKKVISAKASVDNSVPKSLLTSIKYSDQQRREKMKKEVDRYKRGVLAARSSSRESYRSNDRHSSTETVKNSMPVQHNGVEESYPHSESRPASSPRFVISPHSKARPSVNDSTRENAQKIYYRSCSDLTYRSSTSKRQRSVHSSCGSILKNQNTGRSFQDPKQKTYSGDLLEKHSHNFKEHQLFTPRTLKKDNKSFLSQYRYYTPPKRKPEKDKTRVNQQAKIMINQDTQTDQESCEAGNVSQDKKHLTEAEWLLQQADYTEHIWSDDEADAGENSGYGFHRKELKSSLENTDHMYTFSRLTPARMKSPTMRKVQAEEEELRYLKFIADITNEILTMGLYSNRVLEHVFQRHVEQNKHRLDKDKMCHLLDVLREDLGYSPDDKYLRPTESNTLFGIREASHLHSENLKLNGDDTKKSTESAYVLGEDLWNGIISNHSSTSLCTEHSYPTPFPEYQQQQVEGLEEEPQVETHKRISSDFTIVELAADGENEVDGGSKDVEDLGKSLAESLLVSDQNEPCEILYSDSKSDCNISDEDL